MDIIHRMRPSEGRTGLGEVLSLVWGSQGPGRVADPGDILQAGCWRAAQEAYRGPLAHLQWLPEDWDECPRPHTLVLGTLSGGSLTPKGNLHSGCPCPQGGRSWCKVGRKGARTEAGAQASVLVSSGCREGATGLHRRPPEARGRRPAPAELFPACGRLLCELAP